MRTGAEVQGCALAESSGPQRLTFVLGRLENFSFFIQIICWAHWISQVQSTGLPSIFLRAQPWKSPNSFPLFTLNETFIKQTPLLRGRTQLKGT